MKIKTKIVKSRRKTISLEIKPDGSLLVRAPLSMSNREISDFIDSKKSWIDKHIQKALQSKPSEDEFFTYEEIEEMFDKAMTIIPERVAYYAQKLNVKYNRITIRNQKTRWGSCSRKNNLNFNCLLTKCPSEVLDYVVVHELCHLVHFNHSNDFWSLVASQLPEYKKSRAWLKENGSALIIKMTGGR